MKLKEFILQDGKSAIDLLGDKFSPETEIEFDKKVSRQVGTGYQDYYYRIKGTDTAIIEHSNNYSQYDGSFYSSVEADNDYYQRKREYGQTCSALSKKYKIPWKVCLAIGTNEKLYPEISEKIKTIYWEQLSEFANPSAGRNRRIQAVQELLGEEIASQINSASIDLSNFLSEQMDKNELLILEKMSERQDLVEKIMETLFVPEDMAKYLLSDIIGYKKNPSALNNENIEKVLEMSCADINEMIDNVIWANVYYAGDNVHEIVECEWKRQEEAYENIALSALQATETNTYINGSLLMSAVAYKLDNILKQPDAMEQLGTLFTHPENNLKALFDICKRQVPDLQEKMINCAIKNDDARGIQLAISQSVSHGDEIKRREIPHILAEKILHAGKELLNEGKQISMDAISYFDIMSFCAQVNKSDEFTKEEKDSLQNEFMKCLLENEKVLDSVILVEGGVDTHATQLSKVDYAIRMLNVECDDKANKILNFFKTEFGNKELTIPGEYAGDFEIIGEMNQFFRKEFLGEKIPTQLEPSGEIDWKIKSLRTGDSISHYSNDVTVFADCEERQIDTQVKEVSMEK